MNPSNFGIAVVLLCFGRWVSIAPPYEFTEKANTYFRIMIPMVILISGHGDQRHADQAGRADRRLDGRLLIQAFVRHWHLGRPAVHRPRRR